METKTVFCLVLLWVPILSGCVGRHTQVYYDRSGRVMGVESSPALFPQKAYFLQGSDGAVVAYQNRRYWPVESAALKLVKAGKIRHIHDDFESQLQAIAAMRRRQLDLWELLAYSPEGRPWDYKQELGRQDLYILHGKAYLRDYMGNVIWAIIMKNAGWPEWVALTGAGFYQTVTGRSRLHFWLKNPIFFGDDPRDSLAIHHGYTY